MLLFTINVLNKSLVRSATRAFYILYGVKIMQLSGPKGTHDILPGETEKWQYVEDIIRSLCKTYNFREIRTPIFEHTELFQRGVGETTDIVQKEMYTFLDKGDRSITLRPEGTASTVRAFLDNKIYTQVQPTKLYYMGPMFRYERPQAGRFRQFHQFGIEIFGVESAEADAEVISLAVEFYKRLGLSDLEVHLNSVGCPKCRPTHKEKLQAFFAPKLDKLCENCRSRFDKNPLRILDCKNPRCGEESIGAPTTKDCLCGECEEHFADLQKILGKLGIKYLLDDKLVRGLDYYTKTAFEIHAPEIGAQSAVCGGGRYDGLISECGGPPTPGVGFALGMERVFAALASKGISILISETVAVFIATADTDCKTAAHDLLYLLRAQGIAAEKDSLNRSLKAQMKYADKLSAPIVIVIGEDEIANNYYTVRKMSEGSQEKVASTDIIKFLINNLHGRK